ncbi:hypothetical protein WDU94_003715, partial [Cyamophila willieti]
NIREAKSKRQEKHENEDQFIWECPLCDFKREGRKGRQYVNSHLTQAHRDITEEVRQNTNNTLECTLCNTICNSRAGLSSHMRHRHPSHIPPENRFRPTRRTLTQDQPSTSQVQSNQSAQYASTSQAFQVLPVNTNNQFQCQTCNRSCRSLAGLRSHQRNSTCRRRSEEEMESSDTMQPH